MPLAVPGSNLLVEAHPETSNDSSPLEAPPPGGGPLDRARDLLERAQGRWAAVAIGLAVVRKHGEDRGGELATIVAFYAFCSLFPALLLIGTISATLLEGDPQMRDRAVELVVDLFPESPELRDQVATARGSGLALGIGLAGALWGAVGIVNGLRSAFDRVWAVPIRERSGFVARISQNLALAGLAGAGLVASVVISAAGRLIDGVPMLSTVGLWLGATAMVVVAFGVVFRALSPAEVRRRALLPGVLVATFGWVVLQQVGAAIIAQQVDRGPAAGAFATSLVLLTWLTVQARLIVVGAELDAVLANRWWPRSVEASAGTAGDRRTLRAHAGVEERVEGEEVSVHFDPPAPSTASVHGDAR